MSTQPDPPAGKWSRSHRAVVFIHGVGEQERGGTLMNFMTPVVRWVNERLTSRFSHPEPQMSSYPREGGSRAVVRLTVGGNERLEFTESHWAETFEPLPNDLLVRWFARFLWYMGRRNLRHLVGDILLHPGKRELGPLHAACELFHASLLLVVYFLGIFVAALLILLLWILEAVPLPNLIPNAAASALKGVMGYIADGFVDVAAYMDDPARRDAIRQRTEDILKEYERNPLCDEIIVFAHSLGTVVAYDVLSARTAATNPYRHKYRTFISIGSILDPVQRMDPKHRVFYDFQGTRRRPKSMKWLFLYARYDPGPAGPLSDWFAATDPDDARPINILVDNRDTINEDHVTYSVNSCQVVSRLIDEVFAATPDPANPYLRDACQRDADFELRRKWVSRLAVPRALAVATTLSVFGFFVWASLASATPTTTMLNRLNTMPFVSHVFGQSIKLFYNVPSREGGSITFDPGRRLVIENGTPRLEADNDGFVVRVGDRSDEPAIVRSPEMRFDVTSRVDQGQTVWSYTTGEAQLRTGLARWLWNPAFVHIALPALFTLLFAIGVILGFRFYRDIVWKWLFGRAAKARHEAYKCWRDDQP